MIYIILRCLGADEVDDQLQNDVFEEKLVEAIDGLTQKSAQGRTSCLESVGASFTMKYIPEFVNNRYFCALI